MATTIDITGARRKFALTRKLITQVGPKVVEDSAAFYLGRLANEVINGQYVNRISGRLIGAQTTIERDGPYKIKVGTIANHPEAPYAPFVARYAERKYGNDYLEITRILHGPDIIRYSNIAFDKAAADISAGKTIRYRNPFPAV